MRFAQVVGLCAALICSSLLATTVQAQPALSSAQRLANLEATVAQMSQSLNELRATNASLATQVQAMNSQLNTQNGTIAALQDALAKASADGRAYADIAAANALASARIYSDNRLSPVSDKLVHFSRSGNNVFISGANLHVRNGLGTTVNGGFNGLGNLIVGYNESRGSPDNPDVRTGSHNLIVGVGANYARNASIITGVNNASANHYASVYGGTGNFANATYSVVVGGYNNQSNGGWSTILGGRDRMANSQLDHLP